MKNNTRFSKISLIQQNKVEKIVIAKEKYKEDKLNSKVRINFNNLQHDYTNSNRSTTSRKRRIRSKFRDALDTSSLASGTEFSIRDEHEKLEDLLLQIQNYAKESKVYDIVFESSRMRADQYMEEKEFNKALSIYKFLKTYCKVADNLEGEMLMAEQLGHMYGFIKNHKEAANMFRLMLKLSWVLQDANMELK